MLYPKRKDTFEPHTCEQATYIYIYILYIGIYLSHSYIRNNNCHSTEVRRDGEHLKTFRSSNTWRTKSDSACVISPHERTYIKTLLYLKININICEAAIFQIMFHGVSFPNDDCPLYTVSFSLFFLHRQRQAWCDLIRQVCMYVPIHRDRCNP